MQKNRYVPGGQNDGNHCHRTEHRKKNEEHEDLLREFRDNIVSTNSHIIGVPKEREKGLQKIFEEIIAENFPNMGK